MKGGSAFLCCRVPPQNPAKIKVSMSPPLSPFVSFCLIVSFKNISVLEKRGEKEKDEEKEGEKLSKEEYKT